MRPLFFHYALLISLAVLFGTGHAAVSGAASLNQKLIHDAYNEANFDYVIGTLEKFIKENRTYSLSDSVFVAKHLSVVYSANPATREKGRYYMNRLLELVPSAKLVDMYVSEEIDRIFDKVREEFVTRQRSFGIDSAMAGMPDRPGRQQANGSGPAQGASAQGPQAETRPAKKGGRGMLWFVGGVGLAATAGTVAYFAMHEESRGEDKVYAVPK